MALAFGTFQTFKTSKSQDNNQDHEKEQSSYKVHFCILEAVSANKHLVLFQAKSFIYTFSITITVTVEGQNLGKLEKSQK